MLFSVGATTRGVGGSGPPNLDDRSIFSVEGSNTLDQGIGPQTLKTWLRPCYSVTFTCLQISHQ